jgi:hypothetical protein
MQMNQPVSYIYTYNQKLSILNSMGKVRRVWVHGSNSCGFHIFVSSLWFVSLCRQIFASDINKMNWLNKGGAKMLLLMVDILYKRQDI